ncbi:MAG: molybdopterin-binding protein [Chloroflexota bacterium]
MRVERILPGAHPPASLEGSVLTRDLVAGGVRMPKGRRLSLEDLRALATDPAALGDGGVTVLVLEQGDVHEDDAAMSLADAVAGEGLTTRGPAQSRVDLVAAVDGVLHVRTAALERINRIDPLEVFTAFDGSVVKAGQLVASVKVAPHVVDEAVVEAGRRQAGFGRRPIVRVAPFVPRRVGVVVREAIHSVARERFEASVADKVEGLGSTLIGITYAPDDAAVGGAMRELASGRDRADVILTAGGGSTDPADPFYGAVEELGGSVVRRGVPAHPGSMLWLGRIGRVAVLGLPTCGAYSKATAADLVLPRLLTGERPGPRLVSGLGHGGLLTREQRFRFPAYARELDAPDG